MYSINGLWPYVKVNNHIKHQIDHMFECQPRCLVPMRNKLLTVSCLIWSLLPAKRCQCRSHTPGVCSVITSPRVSVSPLTSVSSVLRSPGRPRPRPGYLLLALRSQLVTTRPPESSGENRIGKHDIYGKSFIEFCKNHQFWKLKEKLFSFQHNLNEPLTTWPQQV